MLPTSKLASLLPFLAALPSLSGAVPTSQAQTLTKRWDNFASICTADHINSLIANFTQLEAVTYQTDQTLANVVSNYTVTANAGGPMYPSGSGLGFCNVTIALKHDNLDDNIVQTFWLPATEDFTKRYLTNGGGGWSVNGGNALPAGLVYGAASGSTDGGFGSTGLTTTLLSPVNGTIAWSRLESFAYQAIHEVTVTGKELTNSFFNLTDGELYAYYQGCSEGGREGHMLSQRYPNDVHGIIGAAPAMYFPVHQLAQGWPNIVMTQMAHFPDPCATLTIMNDTIAFCDPLDGLTDGIISRSELCTYDFNNSVGHTWEGCTAGSASSGPPGGAPAAPNGAPTSGTVSQKDVDVVKAFYEGPRDSDGNLIFWNYRNGTSLTVEAVVTWDNSSQSFVSGGSMYFNTYYQNLITKNTGTISSNYTEFYEGFTIDDVYQLMLKGIQDYGSWTETTWPDLTDFQSAGGKLIHWHGEQDTNLFPEASAHFHEKVKAAMFPDATGYSEIHDFYRFFLVPGAAHCQLNSYQPHGPFPQHALQQLIDWVENDQAPAYLNGTTESGSSTQPEICLWPGRATWAENGTMTCENDGETAANFIRPLNGWKVDY